MIEIAKDLLEKMKERKLTLGSVESLTAGLFGSTFCEVPGASAVYMGGLITYDPKEKTTLAGVKESDIEQFGVVSSIVAQEMAEGGAKALGVDVCVSVTGNAGPTTCPGEAPVGSVFIGVCYQNETKISHFNLKGERNEIRSKCVELMINSIQDILA